MGLGNPGRRYERARHNLGFLVLDKIASRKMIAVKEKMCHSLVGEWQMDRERILMAKPRTFMNRSGRAARSLLDRFGVMPEDLIVIYDDLDLPFGRIRIRDRGGAGGHRGVLSILDALGSGFCRIRIGIGRPSPGADPSDYVLEPFSAEETDQLDRLVSRAADAAECLLIEGSHRAMETFNSVS
jgi:PTH1 family peptidyl-tRNA hydrolase